MAVLVEGISVIVKRDAIVAVYPGGWDAFVSGVPNQTLCADTELARVSFMTPQDVETFLKHLEHVGLRFMVEGKSIDMVVVDQSEGPTTPCDWLQFGRVGLSDGSGEVAACRTPGSRDARIALPEGWVFGESLTRQSSFVPNADLPGRVKFLRREGNLDVFLDLATGKELFVGRTTKP
jgi:hypothetical protein